MKRINIFGGLIVLLFLVITSCNKDNYKEGGELHNSQINMTTYDYLKSNRFGLFDTLLLLVDKAGIKEKINQKGTFFAPTDYAINRYVEARTIAVQQIDPFKKWTVDSIIKYELPAFIESMDIYFIKNELLSNSVLKASGTRYLNAKNTEVIVSYEETSDEKLGYNKNSSIKPKIVYFTYITSDKSVKTLVQTSNAQTLSGTLHVLSNEHTLFYY